GGTGGGDNGTGGGDGGNGTGGGGDNGTGGGGGDDGSGGVPSTKANVAQMPNTGTGSAPQGGGMLDFVLLAALICLLAAAGLRSLNSIQDSRIR
ncbi:MAG: hypothetical protein QOF01_4156, partial [Thermomicrobiales bacterium]|nr:hypothetical protein [Thermomicrobiales bacterium]